MDKRELLLSIGFSEAFVSHLDQAESMDSYVYETIPDDFRVESGDVGNVIVHESHTDFMTKVILREK